VKCRACQFKQLDCSLPLVLSSSQFAHSFSGQVKFILTVASVLAVMSGKIDRSDTVSSITPSTRLWFLLPPKVVSLAIAEMPVSDNTPQLATESIQVDTSQFRLCETFTIVAADAVVITTGNTGGSACVSVTLCSCD
jgi:hypothetical protein